MVKCAGVRHYISLLLQYLSMIQTTKYVHIKSTTVYAPRRNWNSPQPPTRMLVCPFPPVSGGRGTLAGEKGVGRVPIPTRGIHCGTLYMYVLCDPNSLPRFHQDDTNCRLYTWSNRPSAGFNFSLTSKKVKSGEHYRGTFFLIIFI